MRSRRKVQTNLGGPLKRDKRIPLFDSSRTINGSGLLPFTIERVVPAVKTDKTLYDQYCGQLTETLDNCRPLD